MTKQQDQAALDRAAIERVMQRYNGDREDCTCGECVSIDADFSRVLALAKRAQELNIVGFTVEELKSLRGRLKDLEGHYRISAQLADRREEAHALSEEADRINEEAVSLNAMIGKALAKRATTPTGDLGKAVEIAESRLVHLIAHAKKPVRYALGEEERAIIERERDKARESEASYYEIVGEKKALGTRAERAAAFHREIADALTAALNLVGFTKDELEWLQAWGRSIVRESTHPHPEEPALLAKLDAMIAERE